MKTSRIVLVLLVLAALAASGSSAPKVANDSCPTDSPGCSACGACCGH